jgi:hypothetical protein
VYLISRIGLTMSSFEEHLNVARTELAQKEAEKATREVARAELSRQQEEVSRYRAIDADKAIDGFVKLMRENHIEPSEFAYRRSVLVRPARKNRPGSEVFRSESVALRPIWRVSNEGSYNDDTGSMGPLARAINVDGCLVVLPRYSGEPTVIPRGSLTWWREEHTQLLAQAAAAIVAGHALLLLRWPDDAPAW